MCIISARIHKAKKAYKCHCGNIIKPKDRYARLFGSAYYGEKPYEVIECLDCTKDYMGNEKKMLELKKEVV